MMKKLLFVICCGISLASFAQTLTDGPIQLQVRLRDVNVNFNETDASLLGVGFSPDEPKIKVWARDNADLDGAGWQGGTCHQFDMGTGAALPLPGITPAINEILLNYTYPTNNVPQFFDIRVQAWEDDNPEDQLLGFCSNGNVCNYDAQQCCGIPIFGVCVGLNEGDDNYCNVDPYATNLNYRLGPPCQWYDHGFIGGQCSNRFRPGMESYWRFTKGTSCADAIDLGTLTSGGTLTHFNSNECYGNTHAASPGNDVWYKFTVNGPIGIDASLCGINGAQFDSYLYLYSNCGGAPDTLNNDACGTQSALAFSLCSAGTYYLVVDANTAADQGTFTLVVDENPSFVFSATLNKTDVTCAGAGNGTATVQVVGGLPPFTYQWSAAGSGNTINGLSAGPVSVTVTDFKGCVATASVVINEPLPLTAVTNGTAVTCGGACDGSATVTPSGGTAPYNYAWNSLPPQSLQTATYLCAGNYNVTVLDANGCSATTIANVPNTVTMVITPVTVNQVQCFGLNNGSIDLSITGGSGTITYAWSNTNQTTLDINNLGPNTYTLTATDALGCTAGGSWNISEPPLLTATISFTFDPRCFGAADGIVNTTIGGGVQPYAYLWSAPTQATTQNLNNVIAGPHTVTVTDANSCTATASATLSQPNAFSVNLITDAVNCFGGTDGSATVNVSGATAPYSYFWSDFTTTNSTNGLDGGPFTVIIEDQNGCDTIVTGTIQEPAAIDITLTAVEPLCATSGNGSISTAVSGGSPAFSFSWSGTAGFTSTAQNPTVPSGSYNLTVTDANGCTSSSSVGVTAPTELQLTVSPIQPNCIGDSSGAVATAVLGGTQPYSYSWNTTFLDTLYYLENIPAGAYAVTVTDANDCSSSGSTTLEYPSVNPPGCATDDYVVIFPTAFSPNGDGVNDKLHALFRNVQDLRLQVFNRWGELLFEDSNMTLTDAGWDGFYKGEVQPMGTYLINYLVTFTNGVREQDAQAVTLIR